MRMIRTKDLVHEYIRRNEEGGVESVSQAIDGVSLEVEKGEFVAILGHNGSGKSTLAKHINALLAPTEGTVWVKGMDTGDETKLWEIRQSAGMVFQNPDNQIIASVVEEDVGFGPENMGVPTEEIWKRVEESLKAVGMLEYRSHSPNRLSGGQKQRVAIAGIMAISKDYYEAASLDGATRWQQFKCITVPLCRPSMNSVIILSFIGGMRSFDLIWTMTGGGPGFATDTMASVIYKQYAAGFYGLSTAGNVIMFVIIAIIAFPLFNWLASKEVEA